MVGEAPGDRQGGRKMDGRGVGMGLARENPQGEAREERGCGIWFENEVKREMMM